MCACGGVVVEVQEWWHRRERGRERLKRQCGRVNEKEGKLRGGRQEELSFTTATVRRN